MDNNQITIQDLASIHRILDIACTRGAFKGSEMTQVGDIYDRLGMFLENIKNSAQAQEASSNTQGETNA
jgi:hypothetical protein